MIRGLQSLRKIFLMEETTSENHPPQQICLGEAEPWLYTDYAVAQQLKQICETLTAMILSISPSFM